MTPAPTRVPLPRFLPVLAVLMSLLGASPLPAAPARAPAARRSPRRAAPERPVPGVRDTLARVGDRAVTAIDLFERITLMPWAGRADGAPLDTVRVRALESLVAEKLLAIAAQRSDLERDVSLARLDRALTKALARDALYKEEVLARAKAGAAEVDSALHAARNTPASLPTNDARAAAARAVREAHEDSLAREFAGRVLGGRRAAVDPRLFALFADSLRAVVLATAEARRDAGRYRLTSDDGDAVAARLAPHLDRALVRTSPDSITLGEILEDMRFYRFSVDTLEPRRFAVQANAVLRALVEGELLAREAVARGFGRRPEVRREHDSWLDAWRASLLVTRLAGEARASDDEAIRHLARFDPERARRLGEVDVEEILANSDDEAGRAVAELRAGAAFAPLAARRTRRLEWAGSGGRSGFFPVNGHLALGNAALLAPLDSLIGPVRLPEGFSVFRVKAKRLRPDSLASGPLLATARSEVVAEQRAARVAGRVAELANETRVVMDRAALHRVSVPTTSMYTRRMLGFGGEMPAAPTLLPIWDWVPIARAAHATLP